MGQARNRGTKEPRVDNESACNVISISGGKDSTATALVAIERGVENLRFVFADTGHEHQQTYEYIDYLENKLGIAVKRVRSDFAGKVVERRHTLLNHLIDLDAGAEGSRRHKAYTAPILHRMIDALVPSGNPFLDLCMWKGRFPGTKSRFCSENLKHYPINEYHNNLASEFDAIISWQGVRRDESHARANLPERDVEFGCWEPEPMGILIYRPIIDWTAEDVFAIAKRHGIEPNPLYSQGMGRVGCMPCIHATKGEVFEIARRFPEELERLAEMERLVSESSKCGASTFFDARTTQRFLGLPPITADNVSSVGPDTHGVRVYVEWAKTARGGRQYDLIKAINLQEDVPACQSIYGLCE